MQLRRVLLAVALLGAAAAAQERDPLLSARHLLIPQSRGWSLDRGTPAVRIVSVDARVRILERAASTTLDLLLENPGPAPAESVLLLPVPPGAAVSSFAFEGPAAEPTAQLLPRDEARRVYDEIVRRLRDPALLEFAGYGLIRSSVFPIAARGTTRVRLAYEELLPVDGDRIDYLLPRSEALSGLARWRVDVDVSMRAPVTVYSPTHPVELRPSGSPGRALLDAELREPGAFLLSCLLRRNGLAASLLAYPDPSVGGGYFLLFADVPREGAGKGAGMKREVTLVLDRSGSMAGKKLEQAKAALLQVLEGLEFGETFNVIDYSTAVAMFAPAPVPKSAGTLAQARAYVDAIRPVGGTNIHDALVEALRQPPTPGALPLVLFLTDGLPTVGQTAEVAIRDLAEKGNPHRRRLFTFGVGADVNAPLLDRLAEATRATSSYVLPNEDVEVKVGRVFERLYGPALAEPVLTILDAEGKPTTRAVREMHPSPLPDLFEGDQFVLLGQYTGPGPLTFRISGTRGAAARSHEFRFSFDAATTRNAFVPRLWAQRRIAFLIEEVRQRGAAAGAQPRPAREDPLGDPRYRELVAEIVRLSTQFGILTEYTSFLAREGSDLSDARLAIATCSEELETKAVRERSGAEAVARSLNNADGKQKAQWSRAQVYFDKDMNRVEIAGVQQLCDRAFFRRGARWVDARSLEDGRPDLVVEFGSEEYFRIVAALVLEGRQATLALPGDILLRFEERNVLVRNPLPE